MLHGKVTPFNFFMATATFLYLVLSLHLPISLYTAAGHDDAWFIGKAASILSGDWLGPYNQMTLIKGPGFSYFMVLNAILGTPVSLTMALLYTAACLWLVAELKARGLSPSWSIFLYFALLFEPALFPTRVIRDDIYASLTLIAFAGLVHVTLPKKQKGNWPAALLSGFALGLFWITREEGIWVLPGFALLVLFLLLSLRRNQTEWKPAAKMLTIYLVAALLPPLLTATVNFFNYGNFTIVDIKAASYSRALTSLYSVKAGEHRQFVPVSEAQRQAIYKVSPTFAQLEPYFENPANVWRQSACGNYYDSCGDIHGAHFLWALRDGANSLGAYKNASSADAFYNQISTEIEAACEQQRLTCIKNWLPMIPQLTPEGANAIAGRFWDAILLTNYRSGTVLTAGPSMMPLDRLNEYREFLGNPKIMPTDVAGSLKLRGWYYSPSNDWLSVTCQGTPIGSTPVQRQQSADIATHFKDTSAADRRFSFSVVDFKNCNLHFSGNNPADLDLSSIAAKPPHALPVSSGTFMVDEASIVTPQPVIDSQIALGVKSVIYDIYATLCPVFFFMGSMAFIGAGLLFAIKRVVPDGLFKISLVLWSLYYTRIALLLLVDITTFSSINELYMMPIFPIVAAASICGIASFTRASTLPQFATRLLRTFLEPKLS